MDESEDRYTPQELEAMDKAQQWAEEHQYDNVNPWDELSDIIGEVDEAKSWLEAAQGRLINATGAAQSCKLTDFCEGLELMRVALGQAIAAVSAIQPNGYLHAQLKSWHDEQQRHEDQHDAQSW